MDFSLSKWKSSDYILLLAVGLSTWLSLFPVGNPLFGWWESHAFELMLAFLSGGLICFFLNRIRMTFVFFAGCALLCYFLNERTNAAFKPAGLTDGALSLRIGAFGFTAEPALDSFLSTITGADPDILSIQDIPPSQLPGMHSYLQRKGYSFFQFEPDRRRHLETALYSRYPIEFIRSIRHRDTPCIFGRMKLSSDTEDFPSIYFISTFLYNSEQTGDSIASQLYSIAGQIDRNKAPVLAMGNFNLVPWSHHLQSFKHLSALENSRRGMQPVSRQGHFTLFNRPTAHIFHSDHFKCVNFETLSCGETPNIGIIGTYQLVTKGIENHAEEKAQKL